VSNNPTYVHIGKTFLDALMARDFERMEMLLHPDIRFRGLVPYAVREGITAEEALYWLRRWFGDADVFDLVQYSIDQVVDRLYIAYRIDVHDENGWQQVAQHIYCTIKNDVITDMALLCSGFRPVQEQAFVREQSESLTFSSAQSRSDANLFYEVGDKGCAEGPIEQIALLARSLSEGQTLEVHATNPSVTHDLPAWCRLAGYELLNQDSDRYVISRSHKEV